MITFWLQIVSIFLAPFVLITSLGIVLAATGKTLGLRKLYINILLFVFEWGRQRIEKHESERNPEEEEAETNHVDDASNLNGEIGHLIEKSARIDANEYDIKDSEKFESPPSGFQLEDALVYCRSGIEAIIEDEVTQRFAAEELASWNLLTRTNTSHEFISMRLTVLWIIGCIVRYVILLPFRAVLALFAVGLLVVGTLFIGAMPAGKHKRWCYERLNLTCYRIFCSGLMAVITHHNLENRAKSGGICVVNHTSPIDIAIMGTANCYAMVGQAHGGFPGLIQQSVSRAESHIWFQRSEVKDRLAVARRLKSHVEDPNKLPILIFPEGTCINNTSIMMFKKGSFEVGGTIYPAAIKYNSRFADPFWNSGKDSFSKHLVMILTSWSLTCDVWYLPPQQQQHGEDAIQFTNRIKKMIAQKGGLVELDWDGGLKRSRPKAAMMEKQQEVYSRRLRED